MDKLVQYPEKNTNIYSNFYKDDKCTMKHNEEPAAWCEEWGVLIKRWELNNVIP